MLIWHGITLVCFPMTESLFLPAHTCDEGTLADIQRWMWMLTAMRSRKWQHLVVWMDGIKLFVETQHL